MTAPDLLILGASTRAAAFSALRANLQPICVDFFADADLQARCSVKRVPPDNYPNGLLQAVGGLPIVPWMFTGGLENHPRLVEKLARHRPLWGNGAAVLKKVRSPFAVAEALRSAGLPCPAVMRPERGVPAGDRWLVKPLAGAGGKGIHFHRETNGEYQPSDMASATRSPRRVYLQEYVEGVSCSAVFVGDGQHGPWAADGKLQSRIACDRPLTTHHSPLPRLLGVTRQLVGESWLHVPPFRYCGSIGPMQLAQPLKQHLEHLGTVLASTFQLRGPFGVDFILRDGMPWPVEINPRYTASVEVLEYATSIPVLAVGNESWRAGDVNPLMSNEQWAVSSESWRAGGVSPLMSNEQWAVGSVGGRPAVSGSAGSETRAEREVRSIANCKLQIANCKLPPQDHSPLTSVYGKAILFARAPLVFPRDGPWQETLRSSDPIREMPAFADIPHQGEHIEAGQPILTLFARAATEDACLDLLQKIAAEVDRCFYSVT